MVLQDIKNRSGSEAESSSERRYKRHTGRKKRRASINVPSESDSSPLALNLPLFERIQMALTKRSESQNLENKGVVGASNKDLVPDTTEAGQSDVNSTPGIDANDIKFLSSVNSDTNMEAKAPCGLAPSETITKPVESVLRDSFSMDSSEAYDPNSMVAGRMSLSFSQTDNIESDVPSPDESYESQKADVKGPLGDPDLPVINIPDTTGSHSPRLLEKERDPESVQGKQGTTGTSSDTLDTSGTSQVLCTENIPTPEIVTPGPSERPSNEDDKLDSVISSTMPSADVQITGSSSDDQRKSGESTTTKDSGESDQMMKDVRPSDHIPQDILELVDIPFDKPAKKVPKRRSKILRRSPSIVEELAVSESSSGVSSEKVENDPNTLKFAAPLSMINDKPRSRTRPSKRKRNMRVTMKTDFLSSLDSEIVPESNQDTEDGISSSSSDTTAQTQTITSTDSSSTEIVNEKLPEKIAETSGSTESADSGSICFINDGRKRNRGRRKRPDKVIVRETKSPDSIPDLLDDIQIPLGEQETISEKKDAALSAEPVPEKMENAGSEVPAGQVENHPEIDDLDFGEIFGSESRPRQQKRRRRSVDAGLSESSIISSPEIDAELLGLPEPPSSSRRSKRLRRKSLDLYRASIMKKSESEEVGCISENSDVSSNMAEQAMHSPVPVTCVELATQEVVDTETIAVGAEQVQTCDPVQPGVPTKTEEQGSGTSTSGQDNTPDEPRRSRRSSKSSTTLDSSPVESDEPKRKRARRSKKNEPSVEDIYRNKLWKEQMPKQKVWETIYEAPKAKKTGEEELMSNKRFKRHVNFDDFYSTTRLKRRRQKAMQSGWKPLTDKQDKRAGAALDKKLAEFDKMLLNPCDLIEDVPESPGPEGVLPQTAQLKTTLNVEKSPRLSSERDDVFFTPASSTADLVRTIEDSYSDRSAELSSANVTLSPQTYETPGSELPLCGSKTPLDNSTAASSEGKTAGKGRTPIMYVSSD